MYLCPTQSAPETYILYWHLNDFHRCLIRIQLLVQNFTNGEKLILFL